MDHPIFELPEGKIEYGMGLHGERGVLRTDWQDADVLAEKMYGQIMDDADLKAGDEVCVLVNGLGSTSIAELAIVYRKVKELLDKDGIKVHDTDLNSYCTSQEMGGFSITLFKLDEELKKYYDMPCYCPFYAKGELTGAGIEEAEEDSCGSEETEEPEFDENDVEDAEVSRSQEGELACLNGEDTRNMLIYIANKIIANKPYLTDVDSAIGDGDHGIGMAGGMQKVRRKMSQMEGEDNVYALFEAAGKAMLLSMGGASGVIFGSLYLAGAKGMEPKGRPDSGGPCRDGAQESGSDPGAGEGESGRQNHGRRACPGSGSAGGQCGQKSSGDVESCGRSGQTGGGEYQELSGQIRARQIPDGEGDRIPGRRRYIRVADLPGNAGVCRRFKVKKA